MSEFFAELKRRHIYRVGAAYVVVAWALTQVVDVLSQVFELPAWIAQPAVVLLVLGFPVALIAAWVIESKPHVAVASAVRSQNTTVDWLLFGAVAVLIALTGYQQIAPRQAGADAAREAASSQKTAISLAVLPFANLSGDPSQEFFSDGITEEITSALARVPDLRVVARTSAYQFRDQRRDIQSIGQQLRATHFIEGSVRRAGDRVRITAQLIKADDATHVWSETFDRELTDIFAIQEDIARTVTASLNMSLSLRPGENLINNRSIDPESYQQYLRAKALILARGQAPIAEGAALLEQIVARTPNYAPAWAMLASAYSLTPLFLPARFGSSIEESRRIVNELLGKAEAAAQRAVQLDPDAVAYAPLGYLQLVRGKFLLAEDRYRQALALDPNGPSLQGLALMLAIVGRLKEAVALNQQFLTLEPFAPLLNRSRGLWLWADGQTDAAIAILKNLPNNGGLNDLAMIYASLGRYTEAADLLENLPGGYIAAPFSEDVARLLRTAPSKVAAPQSLPSLGNFSWVYLHVGAPERSLENYERELQNGFSGGINLPLIWHASFAPVRKTERFKAFAGSSGLVEYWRERGWPQFCHPTTADDFVCE